jgi:arsenate reductase
MKRQVKILFPAPSFPRKLSLPKKTPKHSNFFALNAQLSCDLHYLCAPKFEPMSDKVLVYHNARCSKSRCALDFLTEKGVEFEVVEYLKDIPTKAELTEIIQKLGIRPEELIRKGEEEYKTLYKGKNLSDSEWIDAMLAHPKLIERPIVLKNAKAVVARPTERILEVL